MRTRILPVSKSSIQEACQILLAGDLVAFPTETVYGLGGLGLSSAAVLKIFEAKGRPSTDPLILHLSSSDLSQAASDGILASPIPGTGSAISFGIQSQPGDYTVEAINSATGCSRAMNGTAKLSLRPVQYVIQPQGTQCSGSDIYLNGSQVEERYQPYRDGILQLSLEATGFILNFGPQILSVTYTIFENNHVTVSYTHMT